MLFQFFMPLFLAYFFYKNIFILSDLILIVTNKNYYDNAQGKDQWILSHRDSKPIAFLV